MSEEKDDNIKINIPLFTNLELEEFDFKLDNYLDSIVQEVSKAVFRDKGNILLQKVIQKLQKELEQEKEKNIELLTRLQSDSLLARDKYWENKIRVKIEELENVLDLLENEKNYPKYKKQDLIEEINDFRELLEE